MLTTISFLPLYVDDMLIAGCQHPISSK